MKHESKFLLRLITHAVALIVLLGMAGEGRAQTLSFSPGITSVVAGDPNSGASGIVPASYVGPASALMPANGTFGPVATDKYGNVYLSEASGNIVRVIAAGNGAPIPVLSNPNQANYVASPQAGYAYTVIGTGVDSNSNVLPPSCTTGDAVGDGCLATQAAFESGTVSDIAVDANGNLYCINSAESLVRVVYAGTGTIPGVTTPQSGYVYSIAGIYNQGTYTYSATGTSASSTSIGEPQFVAVDPSGNIYFISADPNSTGAWPGVLLAISANGGPLPGFATTTAGNVYTIVGDSAQAQDQDGIPALSSALNTLSWIATDASGNVYVSDGGGVRVIYVGVGGSLFGQTGLTPGDIYTIVGSGPSVTANNEGLAFTPMLATTVGMGTGGMAFDAAGDLYVINISQPAQIQKVDPSGNLTVIYQGSEDTTGYTCVSTVDTDNDGCAADANYTPDGNTIRRLDPTSVAVDPLGNLYAPDGRYSILHGVNVSTSSIYFTPGQTQSVAIYNTGTANLTLSSFAVSAPFTLSAPTTGVTDCSSLTPLPPGGSCQSQINFPSSNTSAATGTLTVASNATNVTDMTNKTNIIQLTGESAANANLCQTTVSLNSAPPNSVPAGTQESLPYTVNCNTQGGVHYPTGTLTLYSGSTNLGQVTVNNGANSSATYTFNVTLPIGSNLIYASYNGDTYNQPAVSTQALVAVTATHTTTMVMSSSSTIAAGQNITLTATVTPTTLGGPVPTGSVTFYSGSTSLGTGKLAASGTNGAAVATLTINTLPVGNDSITAVYGGDSSNNASTSAATSVTVTPVNTTITLASSAISVGAGQTVVLTATVTAVSGTNPPTGTVNFYSGTSSLGTGTLTGSSGTNIATATYTTSALTETGSPYSFTASYAGASGFNASPASNSVTVTVGASATTTTLSPLPPSNITYGQTLTLTANVAAQVGSIVPTGGTVTFAVGSTTLGTATLNNGVASLTNVVLPGGSSTVTDSVIASYGGSTSFASSTSAPASVMVAPLTTTTALAASSSNISYQQSVTLTATVSATGSTPTGTVSFYNGTTQIGTGSLNNGTATLSTSSLPVGTDSITAIFAGGNGFESSTSSPAIAIIVAAQPSSTTTALTASATTLYAGAPVTFTATVTSTTGTPAGQVTFQSGSAVLGQGTLNASGVATLTIMPAAGVYTVTAIYQGNTAYTASTSPSITVTVSTALTASTTTLTLSSSAVQEGANVTFTATVGPTSPISPTGAVSFMSGGNTLGSATLNGGIATFSTTALTAGTYSVTAVYGGDANYGGSTSTAVSLSVALPTPSFTLTATPSNLTLSSGQTGEAVITLVPTYAYTGTITLSCGTLPTNMTCSFSPATLTATGTNAAVQSTLTIGTSGSTAATARMAGAGGRNGSVQLAALLFLPSGLLLWGFATRRKRRGWYLPLLVFGLLTAGLIGVSGCGGGSGGSSNDASAGTSTITITGTGSAGSQTQTVNLSLTVTQ